MGDWSIVILGSGSCHNKKKDDIDIMTLEFISELKKSNQYIYFASITVGAVEDILDNDMCKR